MMEDPLGSSGLEDNLEIGLSFGDDNQKVEKMNQSFLLLKKKLFRSHDLIQQYSNKMKECERLRMELESVQKEAERYKQQHLTNAAKVVKLNMHNNVLEENNRKLERLVTEQETKIAGDQRHVQQLICKVEDIEDRHSEKVMQIELEKSGLQVKVKELEQEIKNVRKLHGTEMKKLEKKIDGTNLKRKNKIEGMVSPLKPQTNSEDLGLINQDDPSNSKHIQCNYHENGEKKLSDISQMNLASCCVGENFEKSFKNIGINVSMDLPLKPIMTEKNIMTDEFYNIKDNPYPLFCEKCEKMLDPMPVDAICRAMTRLPPHISQISLFSETKNNLPINNNESIMIKKLDQNIPTVLDSLQKRIKILEKQIKKQTKIETTRHPSCCNHSYSLNCCNMHNTIPNQQMQMMEFFNRIIQLPGIKKLQKPNKKINKHRQSTGIDLELIKCQKKIKKKTNCMNNKNDWYVESDNSKEIHNNPMSLEIDLQSSATSILQGPSSKNYYEEKRESLERQITNQQASEETTSGNNCSQIIPLYDSNKFESEENISRKRKRREELQNNVITNNRSNLLKNLKQLKRRKTVTTGVHAISTTKGQTLRVENDMNTAEVIPLKKKRIAHIPRNIEEFSIIPLLNVNNDNQSSSQNEQIILGVDDLEEKRITRSSKKSITKKNERNHEIFKYPEYEMNNTGLANQLDSSFRKSDIQQSSITEHSLKRSDENSKKLIETNVESTFNDIEEPASPALSDSTSFTQTNPSFPTIYNEHNSKMSVESFDETEQNDNFIPSNDNIRELRNRQVHVSQSLSKIKSIITSHTDGVLDASHSSLVSDSNNSQSTESIEILLERHLALTKKKPGRKPRVLEIAKIIHKNNENMIKQELARLINSSDWDYSIYKSVSINLLNIRNARTIAKAVVDFIIDRANIKEILDCTHTPPAPPMTKTQQIIVTLLKDLNSEIPELIDMIFKAIEYALFHINCTPDWNAVEELARMFTVLARIKKDRERVRMMCCDAIYCLQKKSMIILHAVITSWPEVLPMYNEEKSQCLVISIIHIIRMYQSDPKINQIKKLIKAFYNYPEIDPSSTKLACKIMNALVNNYNKCDEAAMILLCKKEGTEWMYKNVIYGGLMEIIINQTCSSMYDSLKLVGFLLRSLPVADEDGRVLKIIQELRALAQSKDSPAEIQEGAISALLSLSRHRFEDVAMSVLSWHPPRVLPLFLHDQFHVFFSARAQQWNQIKLKSRKYANNLESH